MYRIYIKRLLDCVFSFILIIVLSPIFLIIFIMIKADDGGRVIFSQERAGLNRKTFKIYKYRTMVENAETIGPKNTQINDNRITKVGQKLRNTSLDELPQLVNIFKGDMSFIGPRPDIPNRTEDTDYLKRFKVRQGITGLAQVSGRSSIPPEKRLYYDIQYIEGLSFKMDLGILIKTVKNVLLRLDTN